MTAHGNLFTARKYRKMVSKTRLCLTSGYRAEAHPSLKFLVVVNPNSGPGTSDGVDAQYHAALLKLSTFSNIQMVGYVRTGYGTRNLTAVLSDVSIYGGWSDKNASLAMHGIFFDESPHQFTEDIAAYMRTATKAVKASAGLQGPKTVSSASLLGANRANGPG
jgi:hypothetical protein